MGMTLAAAAVAYYALACKKKNRILSLVLYILLGIGWLYTGMTSAAGDQSNIGFMLVDLRTHEAQDHQQVYTARAEKDSSGAIAGLLKQTDRPETAP